MDLNKVNMTEIRGADKAKLKELEVGIRREISTIKMDIYSLAGQNVGKLRGLKRSLARVLTAKKLTPVVLKSKKSSK